MSAQNIKCTICNYPCNNKSRLEIHMRSHTGEKPFKCPEANCLKSFATSAAIKRHLIIHNGLKPFKCDLCTKCFNNKSNLKAHKNSVHNLTKSFKCDICDMGFADKYYVKKHKQTIHTESKPFQCKFCPKSFIRNWSLDVHLRIHTGDKPFKCDQCPKSFPYVTSLNFHKTTHSDVRAYTCKICTNTFKTEYHMKRHVKIIHFGKKNHKCGYCKKGFHSKPEVERHERIHTGERPYSCDLCGKRFVQNATLMTHLQWHTGEKPEMCEVCKRKFATRAHYRSHFRRKHRKIYLNGLVTDCLFCKTKMIRGELDLHMLTHTEEAPFICKICGQEFEETGSKKIHMKEVHTVHITPPEIKTDTLKLEDTQTDTLKLKETHTEAIHQLEFVPEIQENEIEIKHGVLINQFDTESENISTNLVNPNVCAVLENNLDIKCEASLPKIKIDYDSI